MVGIRYLLQNLCRFPDESMAVSMAVIRYRNHLPLLILHQCLDGFPVESKGVPRFPHPDLVESPDLPGAKLRRWDD